MAERIYLDHAATTPMLPQAIAAVADGMARWANPSSPHAEGRAARRELEDARGAIADALGWDGEVILTSGASEAIALALGGTGTARRIVTAVEHDAVRRVARGAAVVAVDAGGHVDPGALDAALADGPPAIVAVQHVNSETGVIQPLDRVAARVRAAGSALFADCAQSAGRLPLPDADLIAVSAHKLGGPPGVGALLVRDLALLSATGGQEQGYRGGTENLPGVLGFAAALAAQGAVANGTPEWVRRHDANRGWLDAAIVAGGGAVICADTLRSPLVASYRLPGVAAAAQLVRLDLGGIAVSAGSACSSGALKSSHVLAALGIEAAAAAEVIRVSFGQSTTQDEIERFAATWRAIADGRRVAA